jgi:PKD domain
VGHRHRTRWARRPVLAAIAACALSATTAAAATPTHVVPLAPEPVAVEEHVDPIDLTRGSGGARGGRIAKSTLSSTHCGSPTTTDRTSPSLGPLPTVKVIYAHPTDRSHFNAYADFMQSEVQAAYDRVSMVAGATKTIRFDVGTNCASSTPLAFVDIQRVPLDNNAAFYKAMPLDQRRDRIISEVASKLGSQEGSKNIVIFADGVRSGSGAEGVAGIAQTPIDDRPDPGNGANAGGRFAILFGNADTPGTGPFFGSDQQYPGEFLLHEVAHTLGAVQDSAPHSTKAGHCIDEHDVLCYADGGPNNALATLCGSPFSPANEAFDCGLDDYLNPAPAAGSYLATHWNLQSSQFMCPIDRCERPGAPPGAALAGPAHGHVGSPFTLNAGGSTDDAGLAAFHFNLDANGSFEVANGATPTLTTQLDNAGFPPDAAVQYPLQVAVTDTDGAIATAQLDFTVFPPLQIAGGVSKGTLKLGETATFDASQSRDPTGEPLTFAWDFEGDGTADSTSATATHAYKVPGTYNATVTVADPHGNARSASVAITVLEPAGPAKVTKLRVRPSAFSPEKKGPSALDPAALTVVTFTMNKSATVRFTVERETTVRRRKVYRRVKGSFNRKVRFGANSFRFSGRMKGKALAKGRYRLVALPTTKKSKPTRAAFRIR